MIQIKNEASGDGTVRFSATGGNSLVMRIDGNQAEVVAVNAKDAELYDGLVKTAAAYAERRGIIFNKEGITWSQPDCGRLVNVEVNGTEYEVEIAENKTE